MCSRSKLSAAGEYGLVVDADDTKTKNDCDGAHVWTDLPNAGRGNELPVLYAPPPGAASTIGLQCRA